MDTNKPADGQRASEPDASSFGGQQYSQTERVLGYGTDTDPRRAAPGSPTPGTYPFDYEALLQRLIETEAKLQEAGSPTLREAQRLIAEFRGEWKRRGVALSQAGEENMARVYRVVTNELDSIRAALAAGGGSGEPEKKPHYPNSTCELHD